MITQRQTSLPPVVRLRYKEGDLIVKQGDYGISIYKIIRGKVRVFRETGKKETNLAILGPGEVIGEMAFLNQEGESRSASVRAMTDTEVEVWHPARLAKEYEQMPPVIKLIADQVLGRLMKINILIGKLGEVLQEREPIETAPETPASARKFYRKQTDLDCSYRPLSGASKATYPGRIKDISLAGIGMEVNSVTAPQVVHHLGEEFHVSTTLPNNKDVEFIAKVVDVRKSRIPGRLFLGMAYVDLSEDSRKKLGFFMMP
ncbi:MAG: hypothetical protein DRG63_10900 [Deltaproteobacteria bacterium]|nr:MAG: hypothetical protein DRG63_10900 [Deltaproteobacteria bacterium]